MGPSSNKSYKDKNQRIAELNILNKTRLNAKAKNLGLMKFTGTKLELINKIYEIETAKSNRKINEFFSKVSKQQPEISSKVPKPKLILAPNITNNKRLRENDEEYEEAAVVSRKSLKIL